MLILNVFLDLLGRFHPLMVHFPIGLLIGAFILELVNIFRKTNKDYTGMVYLGAVSAVLAAMMGQLLSISSDEYGGDLIQQHQWLGWATAMLAFITALIYRKRKGDTDTLPIIALGLTCISVGIAGHIGASITHGTDYISSVFKSENISEHNALNISQWADQDTFSKSQLDRLNLEVRAIFAHNCYQCHSTAKRKSGLALDHEEGVFAGGENGIVLIKGSAAESEIIRRLKLPRDHEEAMPQKGKVLSPDEIQIIEMWIDKGAHWAEEGLKVFREAPIALTQPALPPIEDGFSHPIDRIVNQYFTDQNITWPEKLNDQRFIRRAYMDILGLLPSPTAVDEFVNDDSKNKRNHLISELLEDDENYTLHWLSFWNDLLRNDYSGPGFITNGRKQITNWLYQSLYEEKPYNQMVAELIKPTKESEGFIKGIQWRGVVNASQRTELQAAQNISQSLLGLNLKCASCHNSFINNLSLDQAYGFANIFATEPLEIFRCDKPTGRIANTSFLYPELGEVVADSLVDRLRELANIITQPKNGRLYRTVVNRYWDKLLGRGIVAPVDEMDKLPWSQELLDWLAAGFIENGYDLKQLLQTIMTSQTYQLSAGDYPSPNYLNSENFVFRGPTPRRLNAEQLADAISQVVTPLYYGVAFQPGDPDFPAQWIWYKDIALDRQSMPFPGDRYFRKTFNLDRNKIVESATVLITADHSFELFINGQKIGAHSNWKEVQRYQLTASSFLKQGALHGLQNNLIAVKATNEGDIPNPAGLLFALRINYSDGTQQMVYSDKTWKTINKQISDSWNQLEFKDSDWENVRSQGSSSAWGKIYDFDFDKQVNDEKFARASLVKLDPFMKSLGRPTRENVTTTRESTATLLQAMLMTNNSFLFENIKEGAGHLLVDHNGDIKNLTDNFYQSALGRQPNKKEIQLLNKQLENTSKEEVAEDLIWSVLLLPEFQFL